jgi:hypothetical protein
MESETSNYGPRKRCLAPTNQTNEKKRPKNPKVKHKQQKVLLNNQPKPVKETQTATVEKLEKFVNMERLERRKKHQVENDFFLVAAQ